MKLPARYHVHSNVIDIVDRPCADDCPRHHVYVIFADEFDERYVERPRWHEHDDDGGRYGHDHDGHALFHEHRHRYVDYGGGQFFRRTTDPQRAAS